MRLTTFATLVPLALAVPSRRAPIFTRDEGIAGKYIVKVKTGGSISASIDSAISSIEAKADHIYHNVGGFSATLSPEELETLRNHPNVEYIEQDQVAEATATQTNATWGLARLSNKAPGSFTYTYNDSAGEGTCIYDIDGGIDETLSEFGGRASWGANFQELDYDDTGHGTHTAGTAASTTYGVAKKAKVIAVKVLQYGSGAFSVIVAGMDWVIEDVKTRDCPRGAVVTMSLTGRTSDICNEAAARITDAGITLVVAAGNGYLGNPEDVSLWSPAGAPSACTVGSHDINDTATRWSNYGPGLDIYAPGIDVESIIPGGAVESWDGTSMATPHVAGLAAYFLGMNATTPAEACDYIVSKGLKDSLQNVPANTVNLLAQNDLSA